MSPLFDPNDEARRVYLLAPFAMLRILAGCRALASNMVTGVSEGWTKQLQLIGVGYRGTINGSTLVLNLGFSHPVEMEIPEGIQVKVRPFCTDLLYISVPLHLLKAASHIEVLHVTPGFANPSGSHAASAPAHLARLKCMHCRTEYNGGDLLQALSLQPDPPCRAAT